MAKQCCVDTWNKVAEDEPVFILRGQDKLALRVIETWITNAASAGVPASKIARAQQHFDDVARFQKQHPNRVKLPD